MYRPRDRRNDDEVNRYVDGRNEKNCVNCKRWLGRSEFARRGIYLQARCKQCMTVYLRFYRRKQRAGLKTA